MKSLAMRLSTFSPSSTAAVNDAANRLMGMGKPVINLSVGEPAENTPPQVCRAAINAIETGNNKYTRVQGILRLRQAVTEKLAEINGIKYTTDEIVITSGAKQAIFNAFLAILNPGDEVIIPEPSWVTYRELAILLGAVPKPIATKLENGWKITAEALCAACNSRTKLVVLNSPCNPTGAVYSRRELSLLAEVIVEKQLFCLSDEVYEQILYDGAQHISISSLNEEIRELTVLVSGVSKSYAMTGWRLGYSAAPIPLTNAMSNIQGHCTLHPSNPAQFGALEALKSGGAFVTDMVSELTKKRQIATDVLSRMAGVSFLNPTGAFYVFPDMSATIKRLSTLAPVNNSETFCSWLLENYLVATVPGSAFGMENHIRISFATDMNTLGEGMKRLATAVQ